MFLGRCLLASFLGASAHPQYVARNPNGAAYGAAGAALGHKNPSDPGARGSYGQAFAANGFTYTGLCAGDADGDGMSNGHEMGDECCLWSAAADCPASVLTAIELSDPFDASSISARPPCNCSADAALRCACCSQAPCTPAGGGGAGDDDDDDDDDDEKYYYIGGGVAAMVAVGTAAACYMRQRRKRAQAEQSEGYEELLQVN